MPSRVIAIDGPSASGKSTVARNVAAELGYLYVDSGAVYRGITWRALALGIDPAQPGAVAAALPGIAVEFFVENRAVRFRLDGLTPGDALRGETVSERVSVVAAIPAVRTATTGWLRDMTRFGDLVMEGRDIGTVVFPQAAYKFYLDASPAERARRRFAETQAATAGVQQVMDSLQRRDTLDSGRATAPLRVAADARIVDTTGLTIVQVVAVILTAIRG